VTTWRKSSRSGGNNGGGSNCVEVATTPEAILVRDSKNPDGPRLAITPAAWSTFTNTIRSGRLDP
jgi:hypothetical protein